MIHVFDTKPPSFKAAVEIAACYVEWDKTLLLLQLPLHKKEAGYWGVPAGKLERGETPLQAARRELEEETGIEAKESQLVFLATLYMRKPEMDYLYHMFQVRLDRKPNVHLSFEHQLYRWIPIDQLEETPLMLGAKESLEKYFLGTL